MRKSLGNKRQELGDEHIAEITQLFGEFAEGKISKIFDNEDFGYRRITVERPLKLNFEVSPERIERLREEAAFQGLASSKKKGAAGQKEVEEGQALQTAILDVLGAMDAGKLYRDRKEFEAALGKAMKASGVKLSTLAKKAIFQALSERDEEAAICMDSKGNPEPDSDLRDYENVPLKETVEDYLAREVTSHVPNAWIDESKTRVGYEIPFARQFYEYNPPRPMVKIEAELISLENEIRSLLTSVVSHDN
jgi:type I restriction enzyme M protein